MFKITKKFGQCASYVNFIRNIYMYNVYIQNIQNYHKFDVTCLLFEFFYDFKSRVYRRNKSMSPAAIAYNLTLTLILISTYFNILK